MFSKKFFYVLKNIFTSHSVQYTADHYNGYVAEVTYEGTPVYPEAKPYAPKPAYPAHA